MKNLKETILEKYLNWIRDNTFMTDLKSGEVKIISPFLDARNDFIQIYVKKLPNDTYRLTDGGFFLKDLDSSGIDFTQKRKELFLFTIQSYGVKFEDKNNIDEIFIDSIIKDIGRNKHRLIQCLVTLNDFFNYT
ncbi:MAG: DUF1828 domain-containing protein, partial [Nanoarchaeota archaeon]